MPKGRSTPLHPTWMSGGRSVVTECGQSTGTPRREMEYCVSGCQVEDRDPEEEDQDPEIELPARDAVFHCTLEKGTSLREWEGFRPRQIEHVGGDQPDEDEVNQVVDGTDLLVEVAQPACHESHSEYRRDGQRRNEDDGQQRQLEADAGHHQQHSEDH